MNKPKPTTEKKKCMHIWALYNKAEAIQSWSGTTLTPARFFCQKCLIFQEVGSK